MRRLIVCIFVIFAASAALIAAPACSSLPNQQLSSYIAAGNTGCDVGGFNFSHFDWLVVAVGLNVNNADPTTIIVTPHDNGSAGPSLDFALNWGTINALVPASAISTLAFRVLSNDPVNFLLNSSFLKVNASSSGVLGTAAVSESNCVGGLFTGNLCLLPGGLGVTGSVGVGNSVVAGVGVNVAVAPFNAPVTTLDVLKTFTIASAGLLTAPSSVQLTSITESFGAQSPEPGTWVLLSSSLVILIVRKIRVKAAS